MNCRKCKCPLVQTAVWAGLYAALGEAYAVAEGMLENWYQPTPVSQLQYGS